MEFAVLGPVRVRLDGADVALGGPKQRALLAVLLLASNEVVARDRLIDALWGDRAPPRAQRSLDSYVSRLRKLLGAERIVKRAPGYSLRVEAGELDLDRFQNLVDKARQATDAGDHAAARQTLDTALALWRGPALADLLFEPFASIESERLEEVRLGALEDRFDAWLGLGGGPGLVGELKSLVREHPFRERTLEQLMLALYRSGRHAEALEAYRVARLRLASELGLDPSTRLRELEKRILDHDPTLSRAVDPDEPSPRGHAKSRALPVGRAHRVALAGALVTAVGLVAALMVVLDSSDQGVVASGADHRVVEINAASGRQAASIVLTGAPAALTVAEGSVWAADADGQSVVRISPSTGAVVDRIPVAGQPGSLAVGGGAIWAASTIGGTIQRIAAGTDAVTQTVRLGADSVAAISYGGGSLWAADTTARSLVEIEPRTGAVGRTFELDLRPSSLVAGEGEIWVADQAANTVEELDPTSGAVRARIQTGNGPSALAVGAGSLWVANGIDSTVSRVDTDTGNVTATVAVGSGPTAIAVSGKTVWVTSKYTGQVTSIDSQTVRVVRTVNVGGRPGALAVGGSSVWVGAGASGAGHRGGTLRLVSTQPIPTVDPAFANLAEPLALIRPAYDTLVSIEASTGPDGLRLVPDLALAIPAPTGGGTTYEFRLRQGIRYSDGRPLRPGDFRRAIERLFRVGSPGADYYRGVVGATACGQRCDLSEGIVTDDSAGTVTFHLVEPDPDFTFKLTVFGYSVPIPPGTPDRDVGTRPVPGTGPYRISTRSDGGVELARNHFFHEWSHAAQPEGYPDRVEWLIEPSREKAAEMVRNGRADWFFGLLPPGELGRLRIEASGQVHENPWLLIDFIPLNTHRPPFDDVRVRQALNYAIDRRVIAGLYGGKTTVTCQTLMPGMLGYRAYCPYTRAGARSGMWVGPDLARARALVEESGTRGQRVAVWGSINSIGTPKSVPRYVARVLRSLGYRTELRWFRADRLTSGQRRRIQLSVDGDWLPDYPTPSSLLPQFFGCTGGLSNGYVCDPALDRRMRAASLLALRSPGAAAAAWTAVDREIVRDAYWVPTVLPSNPELVSKRLGNYQFNPIWGFIADQAWLR